MCRCAGDGEDPKLREFLEAMQPRRKAAIWSNDAGAGAPPAKGQSGRDSAPGTGKKGRAAARAAAAAEGDSSDDEYTDLPAARSVPSGAEAGDVACRRYTLRRLSTECK